MRNVTGIAGVSQDRPDGLRERKKARTRAAIREHALRLYREQGYQRTTVEQIAAARQPADLSPLRAVREAIADAFGSYTQADLDLIRETTALTVTVPEVRARAMDEFARTIGIIGEALAKRADRPADDLAVRTTAGAIIGVMMALTLPWEGWSSDPQDLENLFGRIDQALALLEAGLPL